MKHRVCIHVLFALLFYSQAHGEIALSEAQSDPASRHYNILLREIRLNFATGIDFIWDSNFRRQNTNEELSFAVSPSLTVDMYWPISPSLELSTGIDVGYDFYLEGEGEDGFTVSGLDDSAASVDLDVYLSNDAILTLSNAFSANIDSVSIQTSNRQASAQSYRRFENSSAVRYAQRLTPHTRFNSDYSFGYTFSESQQVQAQAPESYYTHRISAGIDSELNDSMLLGVLTNLASYLYIDDFRNDIYQYQIGPQLTFSNQTGLTTRLFLAVNHLDAQNNERPGATDNQSTSVYAEGFLNFNTGAFITHRFNASHRYQPSEATTIDPVNPADPTPADFEQTINAGYTLNYFVHERLNLSLAYQWSRTRESDAGNVYYEQSVRLEPRFDFRERFTLFASYTYNNVYKSKFAEFEYQQHLTEIGLRYNF